MILDTLTSAEGIGVVLRTEAAPVARSVTPVRVETSDGVTVYRGYDRVAPEGRGIVGHATVQMPDGTVVSISDRWMPEEDGSGCGVVRTHEIVRAGTSGGVRWDLEFASGSDADSDEWRFFISGNVYGRNDTDGDGMDDYLGGNTHEFRDDRNGHLAALAYLPSARMGLSLARTDAPGQDSAIAPDQLTAGVVIGETDIGSLGLVAVETGGVVLRAGYPFREERTFALDTSGRGWSGYLPAVAGRTGSVGYELRAIEADELTDAIWSVSRRQWAVLGTAPTPIPLPMEEIERLRFDLTQQYYREWNANEDARLPAGYLTHFSPRDGRTLGSLLEYGFTGAQSLLALASLRRGHRYGVPLWRDRARRVNDFFVNHCQHENGFADGLYDTDTQRFVHWFTGILMPFQYSDDEDQLRAYLGTQMVDALAPVAARLRELPGNYTRTMCEAVYAVLLGYEEERRHGVAQDEWLRAGERFGEFLLSTQQADGSWFRGYSPSGAPLTEPVEWFGASALERGSGTIFPIPVLAALHRLTGRE